MNTTKKSRLIYISIVVTTLVAILVFSLCACQAQSSYNDTGEKHGLPHFDGYKLKQTTVLSRHNIRSPLTDGGSTLTKVTPHKWFDWTSKPSELSLRGGELETVMGQYFAKYLQSEGLISENWEPKDDEAFFYANSAQRTIATAKYFSAGLLPVADAKVYHKYALGGKDDVFLPLQVYVNDKIKEQIKKEINEKFDLGNINKNLSEEYKTLEYVLDFKDSEYAKEKNITSFEQDMPEINIKQNDEITTTGTLKAANEACDALKLQFYEEENDKTAAFGHDMTMQQWTQIGKIGDTYENVLFGTHTAAVGASNRICAELLKDINNKNRKFTFLCGHDSTILSLLTALDAKEYHLPNAIEQDTPIGVKLVFNKYLGQDGVEYCSINLVYQSIDQLRHKQSVDMNHPPEKCDIELNGLTKNDAGLYKMSDVKSRLNKVIDEYRNNVRN
ncbi:MAG: histidine-type phosphatase [Coriobacteriia bacterium]|nr:histidine-type phosphatase [Coriobacteriia bacterium]